MALVFLLFFLTRLATSSIDWATAQASAWLGVKVVRDSHCRIVKLSVVKPSRSATLKRLRRSLLKARSASSSSGVYGSLNATPYPPLSPWNCARLGFRHDPSQKIAKWGLPLTHRSALWAARADSVAFQATSWTIFPLKFHFSSLQSGLLESESGFGGEDSCADSRLVATSGVSGCVEEIVALALDAVAEVSTSIEARTCGGSSMDAHSGKHNLKMGDSTLVLPRGQKMRDDY